MSRNNSICGCHYHFDYGGNKYDPQLFDHDYEEYNYNYNNSGNRSFS